MELQRAVVFNEALKMLDDSVCFGAQWLSVPVVLVFDFREVLSFVGLREDRRWFVFGNRCGVEGLANLFDIMAIYNDDVMAKCLDAFAVYFHVVGKSRCFGLAEAVDVEDHAEVIEFVVTGEC